MNKIVIMMGALSGLVFGSISDGMGWDGLRGLIPFSYCIWV